MTALATSIDDGRRGILGDALRFLHSCCHLIMTPMLRQSLAVVLLAVAFPLVSLHAQMAPVRLSVSSDGHPLTLWARSAPNAKGVIVLLHGRTWSALPDFDLQVPGERLSVMQALVAATTRDEHGQERRQ